ncbi:hypothetical protein SDC9_186840 [bioreactor metagenome]|uniref:Uncharacterized protein n=1 Tax=bioreactor metagenome TaxID=1076179 RepID=A0A645HLJ7_9ZZZZ
MVIILIVLLPLIGDRGAHGGDRTRRELEVRAVPIDCNVADSFNARTVGGYRATFKIAGIGVLALHHHPIGLAPGGVAVDIGGRPIDIIPIWVCGFRDLPLIFDSGLRGVKHTGLQLGIVAAADDDGVSNAVEGVDLQFNISMNRAHIDAVALHHHPIGLPPKGVTIDRVGSSDNGIPLATIRIA